MSDHRIETGVDGRVPAEPGSQGSAPQPPAASPPVGADPSRKSVAERLPAKFKFVYTSAPDAAPIQLSGPITTRDELDAIIEALMVMRDWLPTAQAKSRDAQPSTPSNGEPA